MSEKQEEDNPLESLEIDRKKYDRQRLAEALRKLVKLDQDTGDPVPLSGYRELSNREQIAAILLSRRAACELGHIDESETGMNSTEVAEYVNAAESTVGAYASRKLSFVENKREYGGYYIPQQRISEAIDFLSKKDNK